MGKYNEQKARILAMVDTETNANEMLKQYHNTFIYSHCFINIGQVIIGTLSTIVEETNIRVNQPLKPHQIKTNAKKELGILLYHAFKNLSIRLTTENTTTPKNFIYVVHVATHPCVLTVIHCTIIAFRDTKIQCLKTKIEKIYCLTCTQILF